MVENYVENDTDTVLMSCVNHLFELCLCTVVLVELCKVKAIVTMVSIVSEGVFTVATYYVAVSLLKPTGNPDSVDTEIIKVTVFDFLGNTLEVTALESCYIVVVSFGAVLVETTVVAVIVACVAVLETVSKQEINSCVVPCEV